MRLSYIYNGYSYSLEMTSLLGKPPCGGCLKVKNIEKFESGIITVLVKKLWGKLATKTCSIL